MTFAPASANNMEAALPFLNEFDLQQTQAEDQHLTLQQIENNIFKLIGVSSVVISKMVLISLLKRYL